MGEEPKATLRREGNQLDRVWIKIEFLLVRYNQLDNEGIKAQLTQGAPNLSSGQRWRAIVDESTYSQVAK